MPDINELAVLVSAVAAMILGAVWYGPLFSKMWMEGMGWDPTNAEMMAMKKKSAGLAYLQMFIGVLLSAYVMAHIIWAYSIAMPEVNGVSAGLKAGFWIWLGFVLPLKYGDKLWGGKKFKYVAIDLGYQLVLYLVMGMILAAWM